MEMRNLMNMFNSVDCKDIYLGEKRVYEFTKQYLLKGNHILSTQIYILKFRIPLNPLKY